MKAPRAAVCFAALFLLLALTTAPSSSTAQRPTSYTLPQPDSALQAGLMSVLNRPPYRRLINERRLSVALVDITDPDDVRYAGHDADHMRYAASLPKIGILAGFFDAVDQGRIRYTATHRGRLERMIRNSDNRISSEMIRLVGFQNIARTLQDPRFELYDRKRQGGIWGGRGYGSNVGLWRRDPQSNISHGATARQAARFFVMVDRGELISPWASSEMKSILGEPAIHHKFVGGLEGARPGSRIFRKSGTWQNYHADAAIVERDGRKYVAVVLFEARTTSSDGTLSSLIVRLDDLIFRPTTAIWRAERDEADGRN